MDYSYEINHYRFNQDIFNDFNANDSDSYSELDAENYIVECLMQQNPKNWQQIRGGKYTNSNATYKFPTLTSSMKELPFCKCGLPCDVKKNEKDGYLFFRCAKKNFWDDCKDIFDIDEPCKFYQQYTQDGDTRKNFKQVRDKVAELRQKSDWLHHLAGACNEYCIGGCGKAYDDQHFLRCTCLICRNKCFVGKGTGLCYDCFVNKHDALTVQYQSYCVPKRCLLD
jgi:hypothetical protein